MALINPNSKKFKNIFLVKLFKSQAAVKITDFIEIGDMQYENRRDLIVIIVSLYLLGFILGINFIKFYCSPLCRIDCDMHALKKPKTGLPIGFVKLF